MELEELRLRLSEKKKECDELESRIRQIEQSVEELKNVKLQSWIKTEFDLHYFDEIYFINYARVIKFRYGKISIMIEFYNKHVSVLDSECFNKDTKYRYDEEKNIIRIARQNMPHKDLVKFKDYKQNNPQLFKEIKNLAIHKTAIIYKYEKYHHLLFRHNYLEVLTFLLCNSFQKIFCRDIEKLIAQKIFFLFSFLFIKNKKARRAYQKKLKEKKKKRKKWNWRN